MNEGWLLILLAGYTSIVVVVYTVSLIRWHRQHDALIAHILDLTDELCQLRKTPPLELIDTYLERNPRKPSRAEYRVKGTGIPVWALVGQLKVSQWDIREVAAAYDIPYEAVWAAAIWYRLHAAVIDDRIESNEYDAGEGVPVVFDEVQHD